MSEMKYWRISPGEGGFLWREQKLNNCIAIGWSEIKNAEDLSYDQLCKTKFEGQNLSRQAASQIYNFIRNLYNNRYK